MLIEEKIRFFAADYGIDAVGWFEASDFDDYLAALRERSEYSMIDYRSMEAFQNAGKIPEGVKTVIVLLVDYFVESSDVSEEYRMSNYVRNCWGAIGPKVKLLTDFLESEGVRTQFFDLPQRAAACRAGLGYIGRNTMFYGYGLGSYVGIACIGIDVFLDGAANQPERVIHPNCDHCRRCITACPVQAISADGYKIDPLRCLSMLNRHPDESNRIVPQKQEHLGGWVHGCETCQNVCPLNVETEHKNETALQPEIQFANMKMPNTATVAKEKLLASLKHCSSEGYKEYIQKLIYQDQGP